MEQEKNTDKSDGYDFNALSLDVASRELTADGRLIGIARYGRSFNNWFPLPIQHPAAVGTYMQILGAFNLGNKLRRNLETAAGADSITNHHEGLIFSCCFDLVVPIQEAPLHPR